MAFKNHLQSYYQAFQEYLVIGPVIQTFSFFKSSVGFVMQFP
jgi:hypothetical protein